MAGARKRIVFTSAAYLGDVAPFVEPANRLVDLGHDVTFLTPKGFHPMLAGERFRLATYALDFSPSGMREDPKHERLLRHPVLNQVRLGRYWMGRGLVDDPTAGTASLLDTLRGADLLVTHPTFGSATIPVAEHLGIPVVVGQLFPMMMPTAAWTPPIPSRNRNLGATVNRLAWRGFARGSGLVLHDRTMNRTRRSLGLSTLHGTALLSWTAAAQTVVLASRHYFGAAPADWTAELAGFSPWAGPAGQQVDPKVEEFMAAGDAPVLVCLGTSAAAGAGRAFAEIGDALGRGRLRSLLLVGSQANLEHVGHLPGAFEFAPVPAVVGRCAAAVVSGALGTLAAALTAGVPVVVLPQLFDQLWHGLRVEELGVGILVTKPTQVAAAVRRLLDDPAYARRARELGAKLQTEDGAAALVSAALSTL
jgi:UDP:flavonoid glycosyltransferase YjiC (YdhE family)